VATRIFRLSCLVPVLIVALFAARADALSITGLAIVKGATNTLDSTTTTGQNFMDTRSAVSTTLAPVAALNTIGAYTEFTTRYAMIVAADRQNTTSNTTANMTSSYSITFTVNNPTGASLKIDINTLRAGALTNVTDSAGNSTITLGAVTGQVNAVTQAALGLSSVTLTSAASADTPFDQSSTTLTILTSAITSVYVLQFDFNGLNGSSVVSAQDAGAIRMGLAGGLPTTADDYPGVGARTSSADGHKVDVKATIIATPEPETAGLLAIGPVALALRRRSRNHR